MAVYHSLRLMEEDASRRSLLRVSSSLYCFQFWAWMERLWLSRAHQSKD